MEKFIELHELVKKNPKLGITNKLLLKASEKYAKCSPEQFAASTQHDFLAAELNKLIIPGLKQISQQLPKFSNIIAFIITSNDYFTLAFLMMPKHSSFKWHDHPNMNGFTKCAFGKIKINSIKLQHLQEVDGRLIYPKAEIRTEQLRAQTQNTVSVIYPNTYNIHQIVADQPSGFFDFLMPNYPENICTSFEIIKPNVGENGQFIEIQKLPESYSEKIIPLKKYIDDHL